LPDDDRRTGRQRRPTGPDDRTPRRPYPGGHGYAGGRRASAVPSALLSDAAQRRLGEVLLPASVILAGVLLVVAFGFIINRAMRDDADQAIPLPQPPALGADPLAPTDQALIPLPSPSTSPSRSSAPPTTPPTTKPTSRPAPDRGAVNLARAGVPDRVDLSGEGDRDWVHWGQDGTFSL
jgi:hypothetical protein